MKFAFPPESRPLEGYTVKRGIHRGGFGEVYYGVSDAGKEVALKLLQSQMHVELRGIRQCLNLKHPNLVALFDIRTDADGDHWIVMEYVNGPSLADRLEASPNGLPLEETRTWLNGMAAGVGFLHDRGIVHRDLKPANVFLDDGLVKVGDVGLSKSITQSRRNEQTQSVGTVYYMAPEVAHGRYGHEVDVYALGVVLFEMLTGRVPFDGDTTGEILMKHMTEEPDLSAVPDRFRLLVAKALEKDPEKRTSSVAELAHAFGRAADGTTAAEPESDSPWVSVTPPESPWEERPRSRPHDRRAGDRFRGGRRPEAARRHAGTTSASATAYVGRGHDPAVDSLRGVGQRFWSWWQGPKARWARWGVVVLLVLAVISPRFVFGAAARLVPLAIVGGGVYLALRLIFVHPNSKRPTHRRHESGTPPPLPKRVPTQPVVHRRARRSELLTPDVPRAIPFRPRIGQLTGSLAYATFATALVTVGVFLLTPAFFPAASRELASVDPARIGFYTLSTLFGAWGLLAVGKLGEGRRIDGFARRLSYFATGAAVGLGTFWLQTTLAVSPSESTKVSGAFIDEIAGRSLITGGQPSLAAYVLFFGALFALRRWWWHVDSFRTRRFRVWTVIATCALAYLLTVVFAFPPIWGVLWALGLSTVAQLSAGWMPPRERYAVVQGGPRV